jgi:hypothetical protein
MPARSGFDHVSTTKSNSTRSFATHPCKIRKDGAPSAEMVHAKIVKDPAYKKHKAQAALWRVIPWQSTIRRKHLSNST